MRLHCIVLLMLLSGCIGPAAEDVLYENGSSNPAVAENLGGVHLLSYAQAPCPDDYMSNRYDNRVILERSGGSLTVTHLLDYVCCAKITVSANTEVVAGQPTINLVEQNVGDMCRCICGYNVTSTVSGLQDGKDYFVRVYGVEFKGQSGSLIGEASTNPRIAGEGAFCAGIAGIRCAPGLDCQLEGDYPDAGGTCVRNVTGGGQ